MTCLQVFWFLLSTWLKLPLKFSVELYSLLCSLSLNFYLMLFMILICWISNFVHVLLVWFHLDVYLHRIVFLYPLGIHFKTPCGYLKLEIVPKYTHTDTHTHTHTQSHIFFSLVQHVAVNQHTFSVHVFHPQI
jgi:hypothetical protein